MAELAPQLLQQGRVRLVRQIAQGHVGVGPSPYLQPLQGQLGIPDAAAQQGGVFHDALHKAVRSTLLVSGSSMPRRGNCLASISTPPG